MSSPVDIAFAVLVSVVVLTIGGGYFDRRFKRQVAEGVRDARRNWYRGVLIGEWVLVAVPIALWTREGRSWRAVGLEPPTDWRLYVGLALALLTAAVLLRQSVRVRGLPAERLRQLASRFADLAFIVPRSTREYQWFLALSCTAGVCEELLYRGFLTWVAASYMGTAVAVVVASVVFGLGHAYQGLKGIVKAGTVGLVMGGIVLVSGWLIPAMIIHALMDISDGTVGFTALGQADRRVASN